MNNYKPDNWVVLKIPTALEASGFIYKVLGGWSDCENLIEYNRNYFFEQFGNQLIDELRMDLLNLWGK